MAQEPDNDLRMRLRPLNWPASEVEVQVSAEQLTRLLKRVEDCFSNVKYDSPFRNDQTKEFFDLGRQQIQLLELAAARSGVSLDNVRTCFELGCGHGRATIPLSEKFNDVIAADVSGPHLAAAKANAEAAGRKNISFIHANNIRSLEVLPPIDMFYSKFALQHSAPPIMYHVLGLILPKIMTGGYAYFQISTYQRNYTFQVERYLATEANFGVAEMHMLPQPYVFDLLDKFGFRLLEVREDGSAGQNSISLHILARRK